jgi:Pro-kumamolisin, activation domain/Bacterial Ig-like domain (group 3)
MRQNQSWVLKLTSLLLPALAASSLALAQSAAPQGAPGPRVRITQAIDESQLTTLRGNTHPLARAEYDQGPAAPGMMLNRMLLVLNRAPEQEAALQQLLLDLHDSSSPSYHKWLTPEQFGQQFGPADADIQTVTSWLQSHGFQVARVTKGRGIIEFSGTVSQVQQAFHTGIHKYIVNGEAHWANANDPQIPAALAPVVAGPSSLHNFFTKPMLQMGGIFRREKATGKITPLTKPEFSFPGGCFGNGTDCFAVTPFDFATIYDVLGLWNGSPIIDGSNESIAIVARSNINIQDVRDFRNLFGLPAKDPQIILDGPDPGLVNFGGEETEAVLDAEWSGAVAKGATIKFVVSESTTTTDGVDLSSIFIVDNNLAPVMSQSFGACELGKGTAGNQLANGRWEQAAAQGITVTVSSDDQGAAGCDNFQGSTPQPAEFGLQVSGDASTPFNVAVGGTDFNQLTTFSQFWNTTNDPVTQASAKGYIPETTWNNSCDNLLFAQVGFSNDPETNCNNPQLSGAVLAAGGGGGKSNCTTSNGQTPSSCSGGYSKPVWQVGNGVPSDGKRDVPDVSFFASNGFVGSFYIVCEADQDPNGVPCDVNSPFMDFVGLGGTSVSNPAFAGIMAMVNQFTGSRQGNANYVLYKLAAQAGATCTSQANPASTCIFYDIPAGSTIAMPCATGTTNCTTSHAGDQVGILSGFATTAGYDPATGLGSANANNLVRQWNTGATRSKQSVTTLNSITPASFTHGQTADVSITVAAKTTGAGTPTGDVSLIANSTEPTAPAGATTQGGIVMAQFTLNSGSVASTTNSLPGGNYMVTAHYEGDGTFLPSDSVQFGPITVNKEGSAVQVGLITFDCFTGVISNTNASTAPFGSCYFLRVNVTSASHDTCPHNAPGDVGCPTGTVTVTANGQGIDGTPPGSGVFTLNSFGYEEDQPIALNAGTYPIVATYSGDNSFMGPTPSPTDTVIISKAATAATLGANPGSITSGGTTTLTANLTTQSIGPTAPTGMVTFTLNGGTQLGTASLSGSFSSQTGLAQGTASFTTAANQLPTGSDQITAMYSGDTNYGSTTASTTVTVNSGTTGSFNLAINPSAVNISAPGAPGTAMLTVTAVNGFNGTIQFSPSDCSGLPSESSCAFACTSITGSGTCMVTFNTTAPSALAPRNRPSGFGRWTPLGIALILFMWAGLLLLRYRPNRRRLATAFGLLVVATLFTIAGCGGGGGGGGGNPGTPVGSDPNAKITLTSGSASSFVTFTIDVQ